MFLNKLFFMAYSCKVFLSSPLVVLALGVLGHSPTFQYTIQNDEAVFKFICSMLRFVYNIGWKNANMILRSIWQILWISELPFHKCHLNDNVS